MSRFTIIIFILLFLTFNRSVKAYKDTYISNLSDSYYKLGTEIKETLEEDEVGFLRGSILASPQITFYAKRNLKLIKDKEDAIIFMHDHKENYGKIYDVDESYVLQSISSISLDK